MTFRRRWLKYRCYIEKILATILWTCLSITFWMSSVSEPVHSAFLWTLTCNRWVRILLNEVLRSSLWHSSPHFRTKPKNPWLAVEVVCESQFSVVPCPYGLGFRTERNQWCWNCIGSCWQQIGLQGNSDLPLHSFAVYSAGKCLWETSADLLPFNSSQRWRCTATVPSAVSFHSTESQQLLPRADPFLHALAFLKVW